MKNTNKKGTAKKNSTIKNTAKQNTANKNNDVKNMAKQSTAGKNAGRKNNGAGEKKKFSFKKLAGILCAEAALVAVAIFIYAAASRPDGDSGREEYESTGNEYSRMADNTENSEGNINTDGIKDGAGNTKPDSTETDDGNTKSDSTETGDGSTKPDSTETDDGNTKSDSTETGDGSTESETEGNSEDEKMLSEAEVYDEAKLLFMQYDYDAAEACIKEYEGYEKAERLTELLAEIEAERANLDYFGAYSSSAEVSHIFFHSLIADTSKAFDNDYDANGYNYYMTTIDEFKEMMRQLYEQDYVLVSIHDIVTLVENEDGTFSYKEAELMLPPEKKPFVLSQDDVNYYDYMDGDGFATRMVIDENGRPSTEMLMDDGTYVTGDFDMVPVLETFISEHPDFSYRGARGLIALTGYEGTLGYRTDPDSADSPTYEQDKETVKEIAKVMREYGWEFACHSNGHRNMQTCTDDFLVYDTDNWLNNVGSLVGETDVYIFPYGLDIENTMGGYTNAKFEALYERGFTFYCGVYKAPWIQIRKGYIRMTRRPLDGQAMLQFPERLEDLFDLSTIVDKSRPELK